jgi:hypothetical protein
MVAFLSHLVLLVLSGIGLHYLWRKTISPDRWTNLAVAAGFLSRAIVGQVIFWISYFRLPVARSLQMGNGLWFFAMDAFGLYYPQAVDSAHRGVWAIVNVPRGIASVSFVQTLSVGVLLFGEVVSVGLLLNLFWYLATNYLIVRWASHNERARTAARIAVIAIGLSPAFVIWSLQPLKDTMFQFLVVALVAGCAAWQSAWLSRVGAWRRVAIATGICLLMYALAGIRWYFAFVMLVGLCAFALLVIFRAAGSRVIAFGSAMALLIVLSRAFLVGAGPYVPEWLRGAMNLSPSAGALPATMASDVEAYRKGFEQSGGATQIGIVGSNDHVERPEPVQVIAPAQPVPPPATQKTPHSQSGDKLAGERPKSKPEEKLELPPPHVPPVSVSALLHAPPAETVPAPTAVSQPKTVAQVQSPAPESKPVSAVSAEPAASHLSAAPRPKPASPAPVEASDISEPAHEAVAESYARKPLALSEPPTQPSPDAKAPVVVKQPPPVAAPAVVPVVLNPAPVPKRKHRRHTVQELSKPEPSEPESSRVVRIAAGTAAATIPHAIGQRIGLFKIGGGRNLWWFSDIDTVIFDLVVFVAIYWLIRRFRSASVRNPIFWFVAAVTLLITFPLVYTVTNFGTLFRLREMIYLGVALIPLALASAPRAQSTEA